MWYHNQQKPLKVTSTDLIRLLVRVNSQIRNRHRNCSFYERKVNK
jgi:hypothetical protein